MNLSQIKEIKFGDKIVSKATNKEYLVIGREPRGIETKNEENLRCTYVFSDQELIDFEKIEEKKEKEKCFYMVFVENGEQPKFIHEESYEAEKEARRLCILTSKKTYVLMSIKKYESSKIISTQMEDKEDLPF